MRGISIFQSLGQALSLLFIFSIRKAQPLYGFQLLCSTLSIFVGDLRRPIMYQSQSVLSKVSQVISFESMKQG